MDWSCNPERMTEKYIIQIVMLIAFLNFVIPLTTYVSSQLSLITMLTISNSTYTCNN